MGFTEIFIRRPVFATVLSLIILLVGIRSYFGLQVRLYPKVDATAVDISVTYAGADAALMEGFVTTPIENAIAGVDGIDYIVSSSKSGATDVTVYFKLGYDINIAVSDINSKVSSIRYKLPSAIDNPVVSKKDPNANPSILISFFSDVSSMEEITDYVERVVQPQLQTLPGVAQAQVYTAGEYSMRIWLDPKLMAARDITASDIKSALLSGNLQAPSGTLKSAWQQLNVKTFTELDTAKQFDDLVIKNVKGDLVRIKDIGRAELGATTTNVSVLMNDKSVVVVGIVPGSTANPLDVSTDVKKFMPKIERSLPEGMSMSLTWDNSIYIAKSIDEVKKTIIESSLFVIAIVFLFLCSWRVLLIPLVTIPLSIIGVFGIMLAMGYSLNTITFLSLILAIGMVVDDAIVVSENIHRHIALGKKPFEAAIVGAREIQFAIISMTLTLAAVYAPIGFLSGLIGSLFKEFSFTLASAVIISGFVALTLSPMMCSKFMTSDAMSGKMAVKVHSEFDKIMERYRASLEKVLTRRRVVLVILGVIFLLCFLLYKIIPSELAPREDVGAIMIVASAPTSANLPYVEKYTKELVPIYKSIPDMRDYIIINQLNNAFSYLILKPWSERKHSSFTIIEEMYPKLWAIPGIMAFPINPSMLPGASGSNPIELVVQTLGDYSELDKVMQQLLGAARSNPRLINVDTDLKLNQPQVDIKIDRNKAGILGIPIDAIGDSINMALGEPTINRFSILGRSYNVIPQVEEEYRNRPETLNLLQLRTADGALVPLSNFVTMKETLQPQSLNHFQQLRSAKLTASLAPGYTLGEALKYLGKATTKVVPKSMNIDYGGESRQFIQTGNTMAITFGFALIFIFLVLAAQFESFRDPLIVLVSVPLSTMGALLALKLTGSTLNIYSEIGLVTLIGLISKHGILMVEFANQLQQQGRSIKDAIVEAASIRLRPVLMTTGAMILGSLPLALASGAGAISRRQMGWAIIGGMLIGTIFTLYIVPTMYTYLATKKKSK